MKPSTFDFEENRLKDEVKRRHSKRVLIQLPEGLKPHGPRLAELIASTGAVSIVSATPCYGACDLAVQEAEALKADLVIHFGHSSLQATDTLGSTPVVYFETKAILNLHETIKRASSLLKPWKRIGLITTVQHLDRLGEAKEALLKAGKSVAIGNAGKLRYAGQVIGCDYSNATAVEKDADAFLFVGGGRFHAIGVALTTSKPTIVADPYEGRAYSVDAEAERIRRQRWASIKAASRAERFGVLIGLKSGQMRLKKALHISRKLKNVGKECTLLAIREFTPESLMQFTTIDAYVNTACPRISLDDASRFHRPVLTVNEALVAVGEITWDQLLRRGWFED